MDDIKIKEAFHQISLKAYQREEKDKLKKSNDKYDYDLLSWYYEQDKKLENLSFNITKELYIKLDNCVKKINSNRKRQFEYTKVEIIRIALKLYLKYFKELEDCKLIKSGDENG